MIKRLVKKSGFTLIEMMIVLLIMGILATVIMMSLADSKTKARIAKAESEMSQFVKVAVMAQSESSSTLGALTGNWGKCDGTSTTSTWATDLEKIRAAAGAYSTGIEGMTTDPWGENYCLEKNEGEIVDDVSQCAKDRIVSYGPNKKFGGNTTTPKDDTPVGNNASNETGGGTTDDDVNNEDGGVVNDTDGGVVANNSDEVVEGASTDATDDISRSIPFTSETCSTTTGGL